MRKKGLPAKLMVVSGVSGFVLGIVSFAIGFSHRQGLNLEFIGRYTASDLDEFIWITVTIGLLGLVYVGFGLQKKESRSFLAASLSYFFFILLFFLLAFGREIFDSPGINAGAGSALVGILILGLFFVAAVVSLITVITIFFEILESKKIP